MSFQLTWIPDSPYSRLIKWSLLSLNIVHSDNIINWESLSTDTEIVQLNPKRQVPYLTHQSRVICDSFIILSQFLNLTSMMQGISGIWLRTADADLDRVIFFLARAQAAKKKFSTDGEEMYSWLEKAARDAFITSLQALEKWFSDNQSPITKVEIYEVAVLSMLLSIVSFSPDYLVLLNDFKFTNRLKEIESDFQYREFISQVNNFGATDRLFLWHI